MGDGYSMGVQKDPQRLINFVNKIQRSEQLDCAELRYLLFNYPEFADMAACHLLRRIPVIRRFDLILIIERSEKCRMEAWEALKKRGPTSDEIRYIGTWVPAMRNIVGYRENHVAKNEDTATIGQYQLALSRMKDILQEKM